MRLLGSSCSSMNSLDSRSALLHRMNDRSGSRPRFLPDGRDPTPRYGRCGTCRYTFAILFIPASRFTPPRLYDGFTGYRFEPRAYRKVFLLDDPYLDHPFFCLSHSMAGSMTAYARYFRRSRWGGRRAARENRLDRMVRMRALSTPSAISAGRDCKGVRLRLPRPAY